MKGQSSPPSERKKVRVIRQRTLENLRADIRPSPSESEYEVIFSPIWSASPSLGAKIS